MEFAVIAVALFVTLFGVIEVSRMMFARTLLEESVRRGARLAAVCPLNDAAITAAAAFAPGGGESALLQGLTPANFQLQYLDANGAALGDPAGSYLAIRFVRVSVQDFTMSLMVPFVSAIFDPEGVSSTLPAESLGVSATAVTPC